MESQENALDTAIADQVESAPTTEVSSTEETAEQIVESAPTREVQEVEVPDKEQPKVVKELIAQRKKRQVAEQEAAYWRGVAESGSQAKQETKTQPVSQPQNTPPQLPSIHNYDTYDEYETAKDEYLVQQAEYRITQRFAEQQRKQHETKIQATFKEKLDAVAEEDPSIYDLVDSVGKIVSPVVADLVVQSDQGVAIVRYFNNNPKEATRISQLHPIMAAKAIGAIEVRLSSVPKAEPVKKISQAPSPIKTVTPAGSAVIDEDNLSMEEYYKRRTKQLYGR